MNSYNLQSLQTIRLYGTGFVICAALFAEYSISFL